ncbi:hypothetical protein LFM09_24205 [Lentzea alba]|uniref:hypothetical protein n=1 Tax=Lentzea alba TaxID=2714351 RepID=UPI0039BF1AA0
MLWKSDDMPARSVPDGPIEISVLAADHEVVVSKSWLDILFSAAAGSLSRVWRSATACGGFAWRVRQPTNFAVASPHKFTRTGRIQR